MPSKYKKPPIKEAVCEFRFSQETPWDLTLPGLFYERLKGVYPEKEQRVIQSVETHQDGPKVDQSVSHTLRILFLNGEKNRLVQLGERLLSVNALKPYRSWEEDYLPRIETALRHICECIAPDRFSRIALRYINLIEFPKGTVELENYFDFRPHIGERMPQDYDAFFTGCRFPFAALGATCNAQFTNAVAETEGTSACLLDLDFGTVAANKVAFGEALEWVRNAHTEVEGVFEGCITDDLRALWNEEGQP